MLSIVVYPVVEKIYLIHSYLSTALKDVVQITRDTLSYLLIYSINMCKSNKFKLIIQTIGLIMYYITDKTINIGYFKRPIDAELE